MRTVIVFWLCLGLSTWAQPLDTKFFSVDTQGWKISRNESGLWTLDQGDSLVQFSVVRLTTSPERYLRSQAALWSQLGFVESVKPPVKHEKRAWFLVKHSDSQDVTLKQTCWNDKIVVVSNLKCQADQLETLKPEFSRMMESLELHSPTFSEAQLQAAVKQFLRNHADQELADPVTVRTYMSATRQDWEPFFMADIPPLYRAYLYYLEARFDAAFAVAHAKELGIGPELVKARITSVGNRRQELEAALRGEYFEL